MAASSTVYCVFVICFFVSCMGQGFDFDCRRYQASCGSDPNTCDVLTGACMCNAAGVNYMCDAIDTASGVCDDVDSYGTGCQLKRVQVFCEADKMFVNVNPHGILDSFGGKMYAYDYDQTDCELQPTVSDNVPDYVSLVVDKQLLVGKSLELTHTDFNCGNATVESVEDSTIYTRKFFIQYNPNYRSSVDQLVTAQCKLTNSVATVYGTSNVTTMGEETSYGNVTVDDDVKTVTFEIRDKNDGPIPTPVTLGQELKLVFTMLAGSGFSRFKLTKCTANNTLAAGNDGYKSIDFLEDNCPTKDASALFYDETAESMDTSSNVQLTVYIKAFMFQGASNQVAFQCDIFLCSDSNSAACDKSTCQGFSFGTSADSGGSNDGTTTTTTTTTTVAPTPTQSPIVVPPDSGRRRKRAAEDQARVSSVISVRDPLSQTQDTDDVVESEEKEQDCMEETNIQAVVIILAVSVALLLLISIILACLLIRSKKKVLPSNRSAVQPVQAMHIPRLELNTSQIEGC